MCLNEEIFHPVFHSQIAFERCSLVKSCCDGILRNRNAYQHVSDFDKGRIVAYRDCGLSYRSVAARDGRDPMPVSSIWNPWVQDGNTECCAGSQQLPITSNREDRHVTHMALMDRAATSRAPSQELESFARQKVSAHTDRQYECKFCLQYQDGRIHIRRHCGERTLAARIRQRHTDPSPGVILWDAILYTSRLPLVRIDDTLNNARYISGVLRDPLLCSLLKPCETLCFIWMLYNRMLPVLYGPSLIRKKFGCYPGMHVHHTRSLANRKCLVIVVQRLGRLHTAITTIGELWYRVEAASAPIHAI
ncbi:uncharacterized protein TNCV_1643721 [Trichonephila clavipes]|nr:uncharacterized protein TNCV_1643721 [Trichonephila clavipes]